MQGKKNTSMLTEKELKEDWEKRKQRVANMRPLYDNNKHYEEVVARSKQKDDTFVDDHKIQPTKQDLVDSQEAIRVLEMEINKLKRDKERTEKYHATVIQSKLEELKEEMREKEIVETALNKQKVAKERAAKREKNDEKLAKKFNLTAKTYQRIKKASYYIPKNLRGIVAEKAKKKKIPIGIYIFSLLKKEIELLATGKKEANKETTPA
jgi:hypothetical protein